MERRETILFYLLGLVGLVVVSILSTNQIERVEIQPLPTPTPTISITPQPTATSPATNWIDEGYPPLKIREYSTQPAATSLETSRLDCATIPQGITFGYLPDTATLTNLVGETLTISGTVYTRDFVTPLPDVLIEIWRATPESQYDHFPPFILLGQVGTDWAGQYEFTTPKPDRYSLILPLVGYVPNMYMPTYFHYRVSYQGNCPSSVKLLSADTTSPENDLLASIPPRTLLFKKVRPDDTMLPGPIDIALPVSPPPR